MAEKLLWPIEKLKNWDKNPRTINKDDFDRLKRQINQLGQYKPLIVTTDGVVLGGNMRLRAYKDLGISEVWVSVVDAPTEKEWVEYALSDNDRAGEYDQQKLAELVLAVPSLRLNDYHVDLSKSTPLADLADRFQPSSENPPSLDRLNEKQVTCPECGHEFTA